MSESPSSEIASADLPETTSVVGWLELFFDLVVVAAIAVLTEGLREEPTVASVGMFLLLYGAIWLTWTSVVLYANVAKVSTRTRTVVIAMFLVAVMAASAPSHFETRANAFAIGFLVVRGVIAGSTRRTGKILTSWPLLQFGGLATPWLIAMSVPTPWKFWLWALGLVVDLVGTVARGDDDGEATVAELQQRLSRRRQPPPGRGHGPSEPVRLVSVDIDTTHLDERLGIFVIIVLGEAVSQLVFAAAGVGWTKPFLSTAVASFAILIGLWWLTFSYGFAAAPHTRLATLPPRFGLPLHLLSTIGILCLAAGLGQMASASGEHLATSMRWIMCGGLALYFVASGAGGWSAGAARRWLLGWALPCALAPIALAVLGADIADPGLAWLLFVPIFWQTLYGQRVSRLLAMSGGEPTGQGPRAEG